MHCKYLVLTLLLTFTFCNSFAQVKFLTGQEWDISLANSKETSKPILLDFYTTWCAPCKLMDNTTFKDSSISEILNSNFISLKINAELDENKHLVKKFQIKAYPTIVVIDAKQNTIYNKAAYKKKDEFRDLLKKILNFLEEDQQKYYSKKVQDLNENEIELLLEKYSDLSIAQKSSLKDYIYDKDQDGKSISRNEIFFLLDNFTYEDQTTIITNNIPETIELSDAQTWLMKFIPFFQTLFDGSKKSRNLEKFESVVDLVLSTNEKLKKASKIGLYPDPIKEVRTKRLEMYSYIDEIDLYFLLADSLINEYILPHDFQEIQKFDSSNVKRLNSLFALTRTDDDITPLDSLYQHNITSYGMSKRLNEVSKNILLKSSDQDKLNASLLWVNNSIKLLDIPKTRILKAALLKKLSRLEESKQELDKAEESIYFDLSCIELMENLGL